MSKITAGTYKAKLVGCFVGESKEKKTPYYGLEFQLESGESLDSIQYLNENTKSRCLNLLADLGFKAGQKKIADMADGTVEDLFDLTTEDINLVVELEDYQDRDGNSKQKAVIKFVNVGYKTSTPRMEKAQAVKIFKSMSFDGDLLAIKKNRGTPMAATKPAPVVEKNDADLEAIPF